MNNLPPIIGIVEDDEAVRQSLQSLLEAESYCVRLYDSAEKLIGDNAADELSCVIVDYDLPGINGLDLLRFFIPEHPKLPCIMITANGHSSLHAMAMKYGARGFFLKPVSDAVLFPFLESLLNREPGESYSEPPAS